jgi:hypothetical protein
MYPAGARTAVAMEDGGSLLGLPWWLLGLALLGLALLGLLWWLFGRPEKAAPLLAGPARPEEYKPWQHPEVTVTPHDDLTRIAGISPQTVAVLGRADIHTYARLARTGVAVLVHLLRQAGLTDDPTTWPQQATFAAVNYWDQLAALQARLEE